MNKSQIDSNGNLRHLLSLDGLGAVRLTALLKRAQEFVARPGERIEPRDDLRGITVANLFFEASTRTRASFELAGRRLAADVLNLDINLSSAAKGETVLDTVLTLQAMNVDVFVIRHAESGIPQMVADNVAPHVAVINAGESHANHPTQGLLDALTIRQHKPDFPGLRVAIVGDIRHSRVARSAIHALAALGVRDLRLVGPESLLPGDERLPGARFTDMDAGIAGCDVVMMLRIQKERMQAGSIPDSAEYHRRFGMDERRLGIIQPDAIVMHPGPMNRGVEISDAVADGAQSVILEQVNNGVAVRMAVLATLMEQRTA
ncbi:MAG TPA: aspartate carbamoyltransferase catalytic subunit [Gammaproteobacteria bacterium]